MGEAAVSCWNLTQAKQELLNQGCQTGALSSLMTGNEHARHPHVPSQKRLTQLNNFWDGKVWDGKVW